MLASTTLPARGDEAKTGRTEAAQLKGNSAQPALQYSATADGVERGSLAAGDVSNTNWTVASHSDNIISADINREATTTS